MGTRRTQPDTGHTTAAAVDWCEDDFLIVNQSGPQEAVAGKSAHRRTSSVVGECTRFHIFWGVDTRGKGMLICYCCTTVESLYSGEMLEWYMSGTLYYCTGMQYASAGSHRGRTRSSEMMKFLLNLSCQQPCTRRVVLFPSDG